VGEGGGTRFRRGTAELMFDSLKTRHPSHVKCSTKGFLSYGVFVHIWFALQVVCRTYGARGPGGPHIDST
jgi:hypothetical protein